LIPPGRRVATLRRRRRGPRGIGQQGLRRLALGEPASEERLVRGVLEQAAHEVGHARDQLAERHVDAHALAAVREGPGQRRRHPEEDLDLHPRLGKPGRLTRGQRVRERADVVAAHREVDGIGRREEEPGETLEARVGLALDLEHGSLPAFQAGVRRLVIPVRALHETHGDRGSTLARPRDQTAGVALGVGEVRLDDHADVPDLPELALDEQLHHDVEREIFESPVLHVDLDVSPVGLGRAEDGTEPRAHRGEGAARGDGVEIRVESGELDRDVHPRQDAPRRAVEPRDLRPALGFGAELLGEVEVSSLVGGGFRLAQTRLAQDVQREGLAPTPGLGGRAEGALRRVAGDESAGEAAHGLAQEQGHDALAGPGHPRHRQGRLQGSCEREGTLPEVLAKVADDLTVAGERREDVDEPEQAELRVLVGERPVEERTRPPVGAVEAGGVGAHALEERAPELCDARLVRSNRRRDRARHRPLASSVPRRRGYSSLSRAVTSRAASTARSMSPNSMLGASAPEAATIAGRSGRCMKPTRGRGR
jgi:hypothetical protein